MKVSLLAYLVLIYSLIVSCQSDIDQNNNATVYIQKSSSGYQLIRKGKPFFIKGSSGNSHFNELKKAGANTIRIYDTTNLKTTLDLAQNENLAVILDIPVPRYIDPDTIYKDPEKMQDLFRNTKNFVHKYKNHPALLYWLLGNEIKTPDLPGDKNFYHNYNKLVQLVKDIDKNHPVSTAVGGFDRSKILSLTQKIPSLDLININIFGELSTFNSRKKMISVLWNGPYVFSEFGVNGPWEADQTSWNAPLEQTSTKKAEQYKQRYLTYIKPIDDGRFMGGLTFYWGNKLERTHTWFSLFSENGKKTQAAFEMENLWKNENRHFNGPEINFILLNGFGAQESIVLSTTKEAKAELVMLNSTKLSHKVKWEIRPENWNYLHYEEESKPNPIEIEILNKSANSFRFITPQKEGPYRLFVYVEDQNNFFATANIPFYVLNPDNG